MINPLRWLGLEKRQGYTEVVTAALESAAAGGGASSANSTAAVEIASGYYSRGLALARVSPTNARTRCLTTSVMSSIGRSLAKNGEAVFALEFERGALVLQPATSWVITGGARRSSWKYKLTLAGPSAIETRSLSSDSLVHLIFQFDPRSPWRGVSPSEGAKTTAHLVAGSERSLSQEANSPSGYFLQMPDLGDRSQSADPAPADPFAKFRDGLRRASGSTVIVPATGGGLGAGAEAAPAPSSSYVPTRFGFNPPATVGELRTAASRELIACFGLPASTLAESPSGATLREAWRSWVSLGLKPILKLVESQLRFDLDEPELVINAPDARAADVVSLSRAFGSLVKGGMSIDEARHIVGFDEA